MRKRRTRNKHDIEMVIETPDGNVRPVTPEDLYIDNNRGVKEAFRLLYEWQRQKARKVYRRERL